MKIRYIKDNEWQNFKNFRKEEFKCKCVEHGYNYCNGYPHEIAYSLIEFMQKVRDHYGKSITISSGVRCEKYNKKLKGSSGVSNHLEGCACDFRFIGMNKSEVMKYLKTLPNYKYTYTNSTNMANGIHITVNPTYEEETQSKKYEVINAKSGVWSRSAGYGFQYGKYKVIPYNTKLEIITKNIGTANGYKWDKVKWNEKIVYIPNKWSTYI